MRGALTPVLCDGALQVFAPGRFRADYLRTNILQRLERVVSACGPQVWRIEIVVAA